MACVRVRPDLVFFKGLDFELKSGQPKGECVNKYIEPLGLPETQTPSMTLAHTPHESSYLDYIEIDYQILFERPKLAISDCEGFALYEEIAYNIVDEVLEKATTTLRENFNRDVEDCTRRDSVVKNIKWPTIEEFSVTLAHNKIAEYLDYTADVTDNWYYCILLHNQFKEDHCHFYVFEAKFSIPSRLYPIAQVTVSIYFGFEVSRVIPPNCTVRVTFFYEGYSNVHVPGKTLITEETLVRIADSKLAMFKKFNF